MSSYGIAEDFRAELQKKITVRTNNLTAGTAGSYEAYRSEVAAIKAYQDAEKTFIEVARRYLREEGGNE